MKSKILLLISFLFLLSVIAIAVYKNNQPIVPNENGFYILNGYAFEQGDPYSEESAKRLAGKINKLQASYFPDDEVYVSIIPEKEYYAGRRAPEKLDYDAMIACIESNLDDAELISVADTLDLDCYYKTDPHWRQEALFRMLQRMGQEIGFDVPQEDFEASSSDGFQGTCASYIDLGSLTETITWMTDSSINGSVVSYYDHPETQAVYNTSHLSANGYDLFLEGATPLLTIDNPLCNNGRRMIIFRDSFASSLAPLLINQYSSIVMIDLRYMISDLLPQLVDFSDADVLFLYSASVANESRVLR